MEGVIKSAGRTMQILETMDSAGKELRVSDIAEKLDIPQSSASLLIKSLNKMGFLDFNPETRMYRPSVRVAMLGTWVLGSDAITGELLKLMSRVSEETRQTVALIVQNNLNMQYVNVVEGTESLRMVIHTGASRPLHMGAAGLVLLAQKTDDEIRKTLVHANSVNEDEHLKADVATVFSQIEFIRENGYFLSDGLYTPNAGMLAIPLQQRKHRKPLVIGIGGFSAILRDNKQGYLEVLRSAVKEFEGNLVGQTAE